MVQRTNNFLPQKICFILRIFYQMQYVLDYQHHSHLWKKIVLIWYDYLNIIYRKTKLSKNTFLPFY